MPFVDGSQDRNEEDNDEGDEWGLRPGQSQGRSSAQGLLHPHSTKTITYMILWNITFKTKIFFRAYRFYIIILDVV